MREVFVAAGLVAVAVITLGTRWQGVEIEPGIWRDSVSPARWALLASVLVLAGGAAAPALPTWPRRLRVLVPLLAWILWQLRHGTLWPVAFAVYATGIVVSWLAGVLVGLACARRRRA
jgi:hypothetical protein